MFQRRAPGSLGERIAEELGRRRHAHARAAREQTERQRRSRVRIPRVLSRQHPQHRPTVLHRMRHHGHAVEAAAGRQHAVGADQSRRWLDADQIARAGRHPTGSCGIGPECEGHLPACHHHSRAGARAAAHVVGIERIAYRAVGRAGTNQAGGELVEIGLSDQDRAGRKQALDHRRGFFGEMLESQARRRGGEAGDVDVVLDRERDAKQRQGIGVGHPGVRGVRLGKHDRAIAQQDPRLGPVAGFDTIEQRRDDLGRGGVAGQVGAPQGGDGERRISGRFHEFFLEYKSAFKIARSVPAPLKTSCDCFYLVFRIPIETSHEPAAPEHGEFAPPEWCDAHLREPPRPLNRSTHPRPHETDTDHRSVRSPPGASPRPSSASRHARGKPAAPS